MCQIVSVAREMGIHTIVTDMYTDYSISPAKIIADEAWDISWNDTEALAEKCRIAGVDGVFTGFSEFAVIAARRLCDALGLPFYATMEQIDITRDKAKFKQLCQSNGLKVVENYMQRSEIAFPVVVKPTDNAGSRGISVCYNNKELEIGIEKALSFSASKSYVLEPFMDKPEINVSYTIQDGEISLSCMSDAQAGYQKHGQIKMTDGWIFPSKYLKPFIEKCDGSVRKMLKTIGIKNGFLFITGFYDEPDFRIFEMGYRLGGGTTYNFISYNNKIDYLRMMLSHSLTGKMLGWDAKKMDDPFFKYPCCNLTVMAKPGIIGYVGNIDTLRTMEGILSVDQFYDKGQVIPDSGALSQTFARVNIVANNAKQLADRIDRVYELLNLRDTQGNDMLLSRLLPDKIAHYWE